MKLNTKTGNLKYKSLNISSQFDLTSLETLNTNISSELIIENEGWRTYRLTSQSYNFLLKFYNSVLKYVEIHSTTQPLSNLIISLGGEEVYSWGKVTLNRDIKSGYESVLIEYK